MDSKNMRAAFDLLEPLGEIYVGVFDVGVLYISHVADDVKIPPVVGKKMKALGFSPRNTTWYGERRSTFYTVSTY